MKIGILTSGGLAPCLSASLARLIENYLSEDSNTEVIGYLNGYKGLLLGKSICFPKSTLKNIEKFYQFGGSPIGNSRVKLTNLKDCVNQGLVKEGEHPLRIAADQLVKDGVTILHTIGGDDTNTTAADLSRFLKKNNYELTVVGLPKTIDNDVFPIAQSLGSDTAAEQGALFFENIVNENTTSNRQLIIHEIMGRNCGWLTAATAHKYRERLNKKHFIDDIKLFKKKWDVHSILIPEDTIKFDKECSRLNKIMDKYDCVNIFLSEGAGFDLIIKEAEDRKKNILYDAFGHVRLDELNAGKWFAKKFGEKLNANKILIQKSGYFSRSAKANENDLKLIFLFCDYAVKCAKNNISGVIGVDEENNKLSCIEFDRIKGGKPFDTSVDWYKNMIKEINNI